ncbi:MAG: stage V sporulation protein T, partial [Thermaerobacter sp.]|nr:stage V sporulation protein T [Thermaerobacter sp.]
AGAPKKEFLNKALGVLVEKAMEDRKTLFFNRGDHRPKGSIIGDEDEDKFVAEVIAPIIAEGDPIGAIIICSREPDVKMGDMEIKLAETAAGFLAKQMEQ